jgi:PAP2 superfamily
MSWKASCLAGMLLASAHTAGADVVLDWNATMITTLSGQNPFASARFAAITQLAVFEAVNAITGAYEPYLGAIAAPTGASAEAAAAAAAHRVLRTYFPARAAALDAALATSLSTIPDGPSKQDGISTGNAAAAAMLALRANDGAAVPQFYLPTSNEPGQWQLTPSCSALGGGQRHWGAVTPFSVPSIEPFRLGPPPGLNTGEYAKDYVEVKAVGGSNSVVRPADRADVARFFGSYSPVSWANSAARQVAAAQGRWLSENARALALLNIALSDATVAAFDTKYYYAFWRPETAIRAAASDGNAKTDPDMTFAPFIVAPCFPGYPSNHAAVSYAAREVLERLYGPRGHDITLSTTNVPDVILSYATFVDITSDVDDARVYGGIHFRFDQEAGAQVGRRVGDHVYKRLLRVIHP